VTALGRPRLHLRATTSTNDRARALAQEGAPHGTLVTAGEQHAGRGRQGRTWSAPPGRALLLSLVLRDPPLLPPLAAAVAVAEVAGLGMIKWPNDVLVDGRKVAGILAEGARTRAGRCRDVVNAALRVDELPAELHATAGTGPDAADLEPTLERLLAAVERARSSTRPRCSRPTAPGRLARAGGRMGAGLRARRRDRRRRAPGGRAAGRRAHCAERG
jgi:BirA family biotin operon repressor/biotin-[acetyl-CoA-carboxylase] ligase